MNAEIRNAKIVDTQLGYEDHGIMTCWLILEGDGWGCGFGGYSLDEWEADKKERTGTKIGFDAIIQLMKTLDVEKWEDLKGKYIRCETSGWGGSIGKVGHLLKDKWFSFEEFFKEEREAEAE